MSDQPTGERGGLPESLRTAIERTLEATASTRERAEALVGDVTPPATDLRERAGDLLDEVARLGQDTGHRLAQRGREARDAMSRRVDTMRPATEPDFQKLSERVEALERRIAQLEGDSKPEVEG